MNAKQLTAAETIVMKCIWDADHEMSLAEIVKNANEGYGKEWKPQTVSTYLAKLCLKNYIQMKRAGRTITYEILITEEDYKSEQAREFVAFWNNGSLKQFITAFYKDEPASKDEIEELRKAIEELEEQFWGERGLFFLDKEHMTHEENKMRYTTIVNDKVVYESYFACVFHRQRFMV